MKKVAIIYGWAEGAWHRRQLRSHLHDANFSITKDVERADAIIAHSGGCYMLPRKTKASLIILVDLPHWPGKHPISSLTEKINNEYKDWFWIKKTFFNLSYFFLYPHRLVKIRNAFHKKRIPNHKDVSFALIRNKNDEFSDKSILEIAKDKNWHILEIEGTHDDIWKNPRPYINLLKKYETN